MNTKEILFEQVTEGMTAHSSGKEFSKVIKFKSWKTKSGAICVRLDLENGDSVFGWGDRFIKVLIEN